MQETSVRETRGAGRVGRETKNKVGFWIRSDIEVVREKSGVCVRRDSDARLQTLKRPSPTDSDVEEISLC